MITLYGIPNCDTVKKAKQWLDANQIGYQFHDYCKDPINLELLTQWIATLGWDTLLNKRSTTWRQLPEEQKSTVAAANVLQLLQQHPTLIKRPILTTENQVIVGFSELQYAQLC